MLRACDLSNCTWHTYMHGAEIVANFVKLLLCRTQSPSYPERDDYRASGNETDGIWSQRMNQGNRCRLNFFDAHYRL